MIGVIDSMRARQMTEQLLRAVRTHRARVVVIDITGVAAMDAAVANHLVNTVEASRLLGALVVLSGVSTCIAATLVNLGVDLGKMTTVGDLQSGIEKGNRLLGYEAVPLQRASERPLPAAKPSTEGVKQGPAPPRAVGRHQPPITKGQPAASSRLLATSTRREHPN